MAVNQALPVKPAFEIKGGNVTVLVLHLASHDPESIQALIHKQLGMHPGFFNHDPLVIDFAELPPDAIVDLGPIRDALLQYRLSLVGLVNASDEQIAAAAELGLGLFQGSSREVRPARSDPPAIQETAAEPSPEPVISTVPEPRVPTRIHTSPVRAGQQVYAKGGDLIVLGAVSAGAEVIADGNIHVYGSLRGRALAGAKGDTNSRIFIRIMEAEIVSVAGTYKVIDADMVRHWQGKYLQVFINGEQLEIEPLA